MKYNCAYFVVNDETEIVYKLSSKKRMSLEKTYPNWTRLNPSDNNFQDVYRFFKDNGIVVASSKFKNIIVAQVDAE